MDIKTNDEQISTETKKEIEEIATTERECPETVETENQNTSTNPSDYDSADSYSENGELQEESRHTVNTGTESDQSLILEREEGDGQESAPIRKIDDDEDKKNPQYIPKRGTFYEHDDRTADDNENEATEESEKVDKEGKKKIWTDKKEKWSHDKFNDNDQAPKSRAELIAIYGYDIRNEEGPPRARRRRRYGRGPNKYTRNWEDEDAYNKPPAVKRAIQKKQKPPTNSKVDSPIETHNIMNAEESNVTGKQPDNYSERGSTESPQQMAQSSKPTSPREEIVKANNSAQNAERQNGSNKMQRVGTGRIVKPNREIKDSDYRGFTKPKQFQFAAKPLKEVYKEKDTIHTQNFTNKKNVELEKELGKLSLQEQQGHSKTNNAKYMSNRQVSVPPRLQGEQKGSKRYSSIRQRSLPESVTPPFNQQHYYGNEYAQQNQVSTNQPSSQPLIQHQGAQIHPNPAQMPSIPPPPLPTMTQQVPVTSTPLPPQFRAPFPQAPPPFLQPPPPPFLPQQSAPIINYVQGQPQYAPPQPPYQGFQQPFNPVSQPTEIFQPHGGITYYSAHDQQATQRGAALQKRPKAAIPIVPPPPLEPRGRGRVYTQESTPNSNEVLVESNLENSNNYEDVAVQQ